MRKTGQYAYPQIPWDHQKFRKIAKEKGYFVNQIINKTYFSPSYYYRCVLHRDAIPLPMAEEICKLLKISMDDCKPD